MNLMNGLILNKYPRVTLVVTDFLLHSKTLKLIS